MNKTSTALSWRSPDKDLFHDADREFQVGLPLTTDALRLNSWVAEYGPFGIDPGGLFSSNSSSGFGEFQSALESLVPGKFPVSGNGDVSELVFVDRSVAGWNELVSDLKRQQGRGRSLDFVVLDPGRDGIFQISQALSEYTDLQSVHIVSHGSDGSVKLGSSLLSNDSLGTYRQQIGSWVSHVNRDADILFYGCNLGASNRGKSLVGSISSLTGADVAASDDVTGSSVLGGDWDLEYEVGMINSAVVFSSTLQQNWLYALDVNISQAWLTARGPGPYYLDQTGETYLLQTDVATKGTAFAVIANNITFDLNGHTITYDNAAPVTVFNGSFEQGVGPAANGWDFTNAPNTQRFQGIWLNNEVYDGNYSLKFTDTKANQRVVSTSTVTLEANTTYSLSAMFEYGGQGDTNNPGVNGYVRLVGEGLPTRETFWSQTNWRGIQLREGEFTTGNTAETYTVEAGIEGHASATVPFYIDDVRIQRTKTFGVLVSPKSGAYARHPDVTRFGPADNFTLKNGRIVQGSDGGTWSHGVLVFRSNNAVMENLDISVHGANSSTISGEDNKLKPVTIRGNTLNSNVRTITTRDQFNGAVIFGLAGTIQNNTITNGPHAGIAGAGKDAPPSIISGNVIQLRAKYTNAFAIFASRGSQVFDNVINNGEGEFTSRGISIGSGIDAANPTRVYNNEVHVQQLANSQEYGASGGIPIGGTYGMQLENARFTEVYGNRVYAYGREAPAYAFRFGPYSDTSNVTNNYVHNNLFVATRFGTSVDQRAGAIKASFEGLDESALTFEDNTLETNDVITEAEWSMFRQVRTHLKVTPSTGRSDPFIAAYFGGTDFHTSLWFVDTTFEDAASRNYLDSAIVKSRGETGDVNDRMAFSVEWTTTIQVRNVNGGPLANAAVSIRDKDNNEVFVGTSNAQGKLVIPLGQFRTQGDVKTEYGPYTATASFGAETLETQFEADSVQTIEVQLNIDGPSIDDYILTYIGTTLVVDSNEGNNDFYWAAINPLQFTVDGFDFQVLAGTTEIQFRGAGGNDTAQLIGSLGDDTLVLNNGRINFTTASMLVKSREIENFDIDGGTGHDISSLHGTDVDDEFNLSSSFANIATSSWNYRSVGFEDVVAFNSPGIDTAHFHDSVGDDQFYGYDGFSVMFTAGSYLHANGFERAIGHSYRGGFDKARFFDTVGDDRLSTSMDMARIRTSTTVRQVWGFDRTYTDSSAGGNDTAELVGGSEAENITGNVDLMTFAGTGFLHQVTGFASVNIDGAAGTNQLNLADSTGADYFQLSDRNFYWGGSNRSISASGFVTQIIASANGGYDTVHFLDTAGNDTFSSYSNFAIMNAGASYLRVGDFEDITAYSTAGADNANFIGSVANETVRLYSDVASCYRPATIHQAVGFASTSTNLSSGGADWVELHGTSDVDTLNGNLSWLRLNGSGYSNHVTGYSNARVYGSASYDTFYLNDSTSDDYAVLSNRNALLGNSGGWVNVLGFEGQYLVAVNGGNDIVDFYDSVWDDLLSSFAGFTIMQNTQTTHQATGFASVSALSSNGGFDTVSIHGTPAADQITLCQDYGWYIGGGLSRYFEGLDIADIYLDLATDQHSETDVWYQYQLIDEVV